ncbi:hypothetical protein V6Z12_A10G207900 [Gossypium hirsutum]
MTTASCQDGNGQISSTPKSRNNKRKGSSRPPGNTRISCRKHETIS